MQPDANNEFSDIVVDQPYWLEILRFLDEEELDKIHCVSELRRLRELVRAERETLRWVRTIQNAKSWNRAPMNGLVVEYSTTDPQELLREIEFKRNFWYGWKVHNGSFGNKWTFDGFCSHAGIDPFLSTSVSAPWYVYSKDRKLILYCSSLSCGCHSFGTIRVTGTRERVKSLAAWFQRNGKSGKRR